MANRYIDPPFFDHQQMRADVKAFRRRHGMSVTEFLALAGIRKTAHSRQQLSTDVLPSLETVVKWAYAADLDIHKYILLQSIKDEEQGI